MGLTDFRPETRRTTFQPGEEGWVVYQLLLLLSLYDVFALLSLLLSPSSLTKTGITSARTVSEVDVISASFRVGGNKLDERGGK